MQVINPFQDTVEFIPVPAAPGNHCVVGECPDLKIFEPLLPLVGEFLIQDDADCVVFGRGGEEDPDRVG